MGQTGLQMCVLLTKEEETKPAPNMGEIVKVCQPFRLLMIDIPFDTICSSSQLTQMQYDVAWNPKYGQQCIGFGGLVV